jgi:hypothetical protein
MNRTLALLAVTCLPAVGCVSSERLVRLETSPPMRTITRAGGREVIVFPALDARDASLRSHCGVRRTDSGAAMGRVECSPAPVQWLGEALLLRLAADEFHVVTLDRARSRAPLRVNVTLKTFFVDELPDAAVPAVVADMEVHLAVTTASGLSAERNFFVRRRLATLESGVRLKAMRAAGHELTARLSDALLELAQQYPDTGVDASEAPSPREALP